MADIVYRYPQMESAAATVDDYATQYQQAASTLIDAVLSATASWEGDSRDKFALFLSGAVNDYLGTTVPEIVKVISAEIRESAKNMSQTDTTLSENIPQSLQG
jgi:uncharacterized protein YukE